MTFLRPPHPDASALADLCQRLLVALLAGCLPLSANSEERAPEPRVLLPGVSLELVAEHPLLATPTGIDVDPQGRIWLVANHTHQPLDDYPGPESDEILVFDPDGTRHLYHLGTRDTMDLLLGHGDGWVYLAERGRLLRLRDASGDGQADTEEVLAVLETEETYPHNGLCGLAWHPDGDLLFGLGENFAKPWVLRGADGAEISGEGEGGVFRFRPDGTGLRRIARGFWNPFGICVREDGEIFAVDNDPGEMPPCRLLHVVEGGDYGYQRAYGHEARHPFVGWNGELRGTLPMVHPSGEAPCSVLPLGRGLLVPSWSDHRIDFMPLRPAGASYEAERFALLEGSFYFRPVCLAEDRSASEPGRRVWYFTDWVDGRYQVHGYGRLWRLEIDLAAADWIGPLDLEPAAEDALLARELREGGGDYSEDELFALAEGEDPFIARAALQRLADEHAAEWTPADLADFSDGDVLLAVLVLAMSEADPAPWIAPLLAHPDPAVNFETLRWIAEARLVDHAAAVAAVLERSELDFDLFEAAVAATNILQGTPEQGIRNPELLLARLRDEESAPRLRAFALRLLPVQERTPPREGPSSRVRFPEGLDLALLGELLARRDGGGDGDDGSERLALEAVRALADNPRAGGAALLESVVRDESRSPVLRAEALAGLAPHAEAHLELLLELAVAEDAALREEALRALRHRPLGEAQRAALEAVAEARPGSADLVAALLDPVALMRDRPAADDLDAWVQRLDAVAGEADLAAGGRVFHHASVALCADCHRHDGRGKIVGPDLSSAGLQGDRRWLLESILQPHREVAPEFLPRSVELKDGTVAIGIRLRSSTSEVIRDAAGHTRSFPLDEVASIRELSTSLMPEGLAYTLSDRELRDLLAFLEASVGALPE